MFVIHKDFFCGCVLQRESFQDQIECKSTEYYCPLDKQCHPYCGNVIDSTGKMFPCDTTSQLPYDPNGPLISTSPDGTQTEMNGLLIPNNKDYESQLKFDISRYAVGTVPKSEMEKARVKVLPSPSCKLLNTSASAVFSLNTEKMPIVFLASDTVFPITSSFKEGKVVKFDSDHVVRNKNLSQSGVMRFPYAMKVQLKWDPKTYLDRNNDTFTLYNSSKADPNRILYQWKYDGKTNNPFPAEGVTLYNNVITWEITSKQKNNAWGVRMYALPYYAVNSNNLLQTLLVTSTLGLENGYQIKVGDEVTSIADIKSNILYVPLLQYNHFKGESVVPL